MYLIVPCRVAPSHVPLNQRTRPFVSLKFKDPNSNANIEYLPEWVDSNLRQILMSTRVNEKTTPQRCGGAAFCFCCRSRADGGSGRGCCRRGPERTPKANRPFAFLVLLATIFRWPQEIHLLLLPKGQVRLGCGSNFWVFEPEPFKTTPRVWHCNQAPAPFSTLQWDLHEVQGISEPTDDQP